MFGRVRQLVFGRFARDTAATQAGLIASAACALGTSIILARGLGEAGYGKYALVFALYGLVNILGDMGLGKASIRGVAEARVAQDRAAFVGQVAYLMKMTVVIGVTVTVIGLVLAPVLARLMNPSLGIGPYARVLFLTSLLGMGRGFTGTLLAGMRRMRILAAFDVSFAALRLAAVGAAVAAGFGLWGVVGAHVGATLVVSLLGVGIYRRHARRDEALPPLKQLGREAVRAPWWRTFKLGAQVTLDRQLLKLIEVVPVLLLGRLAASPEPAGYFNLARNIMRNLGLAFLGLSKSLLPFFAELKARRQLARMRRDYTRAVIASGAAAVVLAAVCVPLLPVVLGFFYGKAWAAAATGVAYVLLGKFVADGFCVGLGALIVVSGKVLWSARLKLASLPLGVGALIGGALAGRSWHADPLVGAAVGAAAAYAVWWVALSLVQFIASFRMLDALAVEKAAAEVAEPQPEMDF